MSTLDSRVRSTIFRGGRSQMTATMTIMPMEIHGEKKATGMEPRYRQNEAACFTMPLAGGVPLRRWMRVDRTIHGMPGKAQMAP